MQPLCQQAFTLSLPGGPCGAVCGVPHKRGKPVCGSPHMPRPALTCARLLAEDDGF
jgi:hypothetical protein